VITTPGEQRTSGRSPVPSSYYKKSRRQAFHVTTRTERQQAQVEYVVNSSAHTVFDSQDASDVRLWTWADLLSNKPFQVEAAVVGREEPTVVVVLGLGSSPRRWAARWLT